MLLHIQKDGINCVLTAQRSGAVAQSAQDLHLLVLDTATAFVSYAAYSRSEHIHGKVVSESAGRFFTKFCIEILHEELLEDFNFGSYRNLSI
jgi:hypothetical protein